MYLTIALVILIPISVRVHRFLTRDKAARKLRDQFTQSGNARDESRDRSTSGD